MTGLEALPALTAYAINYRSENIPSISHLPLNNDVESILAVAFWGTLGIFSLGFTAYMLIQTYDLIEMARKYHESQQSRPDSIPPADNEQLATKATSNPRIILNHNESLRLPVDSEPDSPLYSTKPEERFMSRPKSNVTNRRQK